MNTKAFFNIMALAAALSCASAQPGPDREWKVTLRVADGTGQPVSGAEAWVNYLTNRFVGSTDTRGVFIASHRDRSAQLAFHIEKSGYYPFWMRYDMGFDYTLAKWNPTVEIVLNRIMNPIPMYARRAQIEIPALDKPIGFDLTDYDWVAPYGKGTHSDFIFEAHRRWASRHDFDMTLKVTFSNPGDGLIAVPSQAEQASGPRLLNPAPPDGYVPELSRALSNTPAGGWKSESKDQNYYFRMRGSPDANGGVKTALYGKIYGDFALDPINSKTAFILFTYYLNPEPGSRNVEFDPKRNLFKNLPALQEVNDP